MMAKIQFTHSTWMSAYNLTDSLIEAGWPEEANYVEENILGAEYELQVEYDTQTAKFSFLAVRGVD